jgi:glycosyltransferase involved in cell wall biosynthesis
VKLCYLVDYRSAISRSWIRYFIERGHEIHVVSTFPHNVADARTKSMTHIPIAFSRMRARSTFRQHLAVTGGNDGPKSGVARAAGRALRAASTSARKAYDKIAPYEVWLHAGRTRDVMRDIQPDLVHAMRIPFEGILAAQALKRVDVPLLVSVWGNDFTFHARNVRAISRATRMVMARCDALHADCARDLRVAKEWGFPSDRPTLLVPGNGGVRTEVFHPGAPDAELLRRWNIPHDAPIVLNARNFRQYVRNDVFFASIPVVARAVPNAMFVCIGMQGNPIAESWVGRYGIERSVRLLPSVTQDEMAPLFRAAQVAVSPSNHDGTPNTLLEAMASGAFPVAGDIESVREWIESGKNGLLCDPNRPATLAQAIVAALQTPALREAARAINLDLIGRRAEYHAGMRRAEEFYTGLTGG